VRIAHRHTARRTGCELPRLHRRIGPAIIARRQSITVKAPLRGGNSGDLDRAAGRARPRRRAQGECRNSRLTTGNDSLLSTGPEQKIASTIKSGRGPAQRIPGRKRAGGEREVRQSKSRQAQRRRRQVASAHRMGADGCQHNTKLRGARHGRLPSAMMTNDLSSCIGAHKFGEPDHVSNPTNAAGIFTSRDKPAPARDAAAQPFAPDLLNGEGLDLLDSARRSRTGSAELRSPSPHQSFGLPQSGDLKRPIGCSIRSLRSPRPPAIVADGVVSAFRQSGRPAGGSGSTTYHQCGARVLDVPGATLLLLRGCC